MFHHIAKCQEDLWGDQCNKPRNCSFPGSKNNRCDLTTGSCECYKSHEGFKCERQKNPPNCPPGTHKFDDHDMELKDCKKCTVR